MTVCKVLSIIFAVLFSNLCFATNGYFQIGYGPKSRALVGATTALPQDSMAAATNPAGMGLIPSSADVSLELFSPKRSASAAMGGFPGSSESDSNIFLIPNFGYVRKSPNGSLGITVYANGGMNTDYPANLPGPSNLFGDPGQLGVNLRQLIFAPTYTRNKDKHSFGVSLLLAYQTFEAKGLANFAGLKPPAAPAGNTGLTNQGEDSALGYGLRIGWVGNFDKFQLGAAYASKIFMGEFDDYRYLFAEQGDFDIPSNWSLGIAYQLNNRLTLLTDIQGIQYGEVASIANAGPTTTGVNVFADGQGFLGDNNGLGFGWENMIILKFAALYQYSAAIDLRFGLSHAEQPIDSGQATFNILAPAVIETHLALGMSYKAKGSKLQYSLTYNHALKNEVVGDFPQGFGGTPGSNQVNLEMQQHTVDAGINWSF